MIVYNGHESLVPKKEQLSSEVFSCARQIEDSLRNNPEYQEQVAGQDAGTDPIHEIILDASHAAEQADAHPENEGKAKELLELLKRLSELAKQLDAAKQVDYEIGLYLGSKLIEWQKSFQARLQKRAGELKQAYQTREPNSSYAKWTEQEWMADLEKYLNESKVVNYPVGGDTTATVKQHIDYHFNERTRGGLEPPKEGQEYTFKAKQLKTLINGIRELAPNLYKR